jgi:hypothetical protein
MYMFLCVADFVLSFVEFHFRRFSEKNVVEEAKKVRMKQREDDTVEELDTML